MDGSLRFKVDSRAAEEHFGLREDVIVAALVERTTAINTALKDKIAGKLNGPLLKSHSGKLMNSIRTAPTRIDGNKIKGGVLGGGGVAPYGRFLEDGTHGPYTILPKDPKSVLAFIVGGKQVFAKKVTHPGLKAYRFMKGTLEEERGYILDQYKEAIREAMG